MDEIQEPQTNNTQTNLQKESINDKIEQSIQERLPTTEDHSKKSNNKQHKKHQT